MHIIVQAFGALAVIVGAVIAFIGFSQEAPGTMILWSVALPMVLSGALLFCFGTMTAHLAAIRKDQRRTADTIEAMFKSGPATTAPRERL